MSLIDSYVSLSSLIKAIFQRVSKSGSLSFPMTIGVGLKEAIDFLLRELGCIAGSVRDARCKLRYALCNV